MGYPHFRKPPYKCSFIFGKHRPTLTLTTSYVGVHRRDPPSRHPAKRPLPIQNRSKWFAGTWEPSTGAANDQHDQNGGVLGFGAFRQSENLHSLPQLTWIFKLKTRTKTWNKMTSEWHGPKRWMCFIMCFNIISDHLPSDFKD